MNKRDKEQLQAISDQIEMVARLIWKDKERNAIGMKAGYAVEAHCLQDARKRIKKLLNL